jgi:uncharacterized protein (DUF1684 family)
MISRGAAVVISIVGIIVDIGAADSAHVREVQEWRAKHEESYRRDWASIEGLFFLKPGENRVGSDRANDVVLSARTPASVGRFVLQDDRVVFEPDPGVAASLKDKAVTSAVELNPDGGAARADELIVNGIRIEVHRSGERLAIRVRDEHGERARSFLGFRWFPIDGQYRVTGRFIPDPQPHEVRIPNTLGDIDTYTTEGVVEFTLKGQTMRMRPMTTRPKRFYFVFKDLSSGHETYAAARFLYSDLREDGTTVLDFNEAYNPPCAFNPYTSCPVPPAENRLKVRVLAGERAYPHEPVRRTQ